MRISSIVLLRRRDCAGGAGPVVEAPRMDVPRPAAVVPAFVVVADAALAVVVVAACEVEFVVVDAGLSGTLNKLLNGALEEVVGAVVEAGV